MPGKRLANALFLAILFGAVVQCLHDLPLLPERMASHFAASGAPNGWMSKSQFLGIYALTLLPALAVEFWVARRISKTSGARLHLPNKQYWLAPEHREATYAYFESFFAWYGCALLFLLVFAMGLAMRANLNAPPRLPSGPIVSAIGGFVVFNLAAIVVMLRRFSVPQ